jgi:hypothetical protein
MDDTNYNSCTVRQTCSNRAHLSNFFYHRCHSFTKLIWTRGKFTTGSLLNILFCFVSFYLLFYSSYILRRWLQMTHQPNSLTTSSIAPEEAQTTANLTCKRRCDLWILNNVILCVWIWICGCWCCVWMNYICECECCLWILWSVWIWIWMLMCMCCVWINCICGCECIMQVLKFQMQSWLYSICVIFFFKF